MLLLLKIEQAIGLMDDPSFGVRVAVSIPCFPQRFLRRHQGFHGGVHGQLASLHLVRSLDTSVSNLMNDSRDT